LEINNLNNQNQHNSKLVLQLKKKPNSKRNQLNKRLRVNSKTLKLENRKRRRHQFSNKSNQKNAKQSRRRRRLNHLPNHLPKKRINNSHNGVVICSLKNLPSPVLLPRQQEISQKVRRRAIQFLVGVNLSSSCSSLQTSLSFASIASTKSTTTHSRYSTFNRRSRRSMKMETRSRDGVQPNPFLIARSKMSQQRQMKHLKNSSRTSFGLVLISIP